LIAVALLVAISLTVTLTAVAGARRTHSAPARFLRNDRTPDVQIGLGALDSLRGVDAIAQLPQIRDIAISAGMASYPYTKAGVYMPVFAPIDGKAGVTAARGILLSGRRPDPKRADEIMLSEGHARILHAHVGDRIPMVAFDQKQAEQCLYADQSPPICVRLFRTPRFSVRVVGISRTAPDVNNRSSDISVSVLSGGYFERHRSTIAWTPNLSIRLRPGVSTESFVAAVRKALPEGVDANFDLINASATFDAVNVLTTGLWLFALVAGLAGAFAVGQAVARQVRSDDDERTVLAGLGASRRTLLADAFAPVGLAVLFGIGVALLGNYFASVLMPIGFARRIDPHRGRELDWTVFAAGVVVCVALVIGATGVAVRSARRRVKSRTARSLPAVLANVSPSAMVGLRHASSPGRGSRAVPVRSALVGVAAATAGIIGVLGFSAGLSHLIDTPSLYGWNFDAVGIPNQYAAPVTHDPDVSAVAVVHAGVALRIKGRPALGFVIEPIRGEIRPAIAAGRAPVAIDEVALGADTLDKAHVHIGGSVVIEGTKRKRTMRVVGQGVFPTEGDAYPLADGAYLTAAALRDVGEGDANKTLAVRFRPGTDRAATIARLHAIYAKSDPGADPPGIPTPPAEIEKLRQVESLPKVLAGFLALLGAIAVAHALVVGVRRRAGTFAVLRAIGFRRRQVGAAVAWEAGLLAFVGAAIGIPVGIVIARFAWARTARGIGVAVVDRVPVGVLLALAPAAVILAIAVALLPARRAAKVRPAEILRTE
jgi:hypothetical protein